MFTSTREIVSLILQFLDEEKFKDTVHILEKESGVCFNMKYLEDAVTSGEWDEVDKYLSAFTNVNDNWYSTKIFFVIRQQKYLEALHKHDYGRAVEILRRDLNVFSSFNDDLVKEMTLLLKLPNFRDNDKLSKYEDTNTERSNMLVELKKLIKANPLFQDKLQFPRLKKSRLRTLLNQSLNWQHQQCKYPKSNLDIKTLFRDHTCGEPNNAQSPSLVTNQLTVFMPKPFQPGPTSITTSSGGWIANPSTMPNPGISGGTIGLIASNNAASMLKHPVPPTNLAINFHTEDSEHVLNRGRPFGSLDEASQFNNPPISSFPSHPSPSQSHPHASYSSDDLPKTVLSTLNHRSAVKSMDFHPVQQTLLLVGTDVGDIAVWEVGSRDRLAFKKFEVWNLGACSMTLQASLASEYTASVNHVMWSPDGTLFGVAYSKHIMHLYSFQGGLRNHLEIEAHVGNVSDLDFLYPKKQLCIITCGDDKAIKVWDAVTGAKQYTFEGHEAPVCSVCPLRKEHVQIIFSTSVDGKIKVWLCDNMGSLVEFDAPGQSCSRMAFSADGTRLFSCGTNKDGESHIVEWNDSDGSVKRSYLGLGKRSMGVIQFDTLKTRFLAAGDAFVIKFWDIDNVNLLTTTDAGGGLPASPCVRFSKEGILLAVSTLENGVKILGNAEGLRLVHTTDNWKLDASRAVSGNVLKPPILEAYGASSLSAATNIGVAERGAPVTANVLLNGEGRTLSDVKSRITDDTEKSKAWKLAEINEKTQLRSLRIPDNLLSGQITRLIYTNSGGAILALASNAIHRLWEWQTNEHNLGGKATTSVPPQLGQRSCGILMTNDISETNQKKFVPCFALSKNDFYVVSASGGKISLFNMKSFKTITTFMSPPPAATFLAFHPQDNNIIAIGMEDSSIQIYNIRFDEVKSKLKGHQRRVTGLAFSTVLNVLVSSGADAQICVWSMDGWGKQASKFLHIPSGRAPTPIGQARIQFHQDQTHVLIVNETQIAICKAPKLECIKQWLPIESSGSITDATYSGDGQSIYATFVDGCISVFTATALSLRCRIRPTAYLPTSISSWVYPLVITAHPNDRNQFALGLNNGDVQVLEPLESEGNWGTIPPQENSAGPSTNPVAASSEQLLPR